MPSLETLESETFYGCVSLKTVIMPKLKTASANTFFACTSLEEITFESLEVLVSNNFNSCSSLKSVTLPKIKTIGSNVFESCSALKTLTLGAPPTVEANAFSNVTLSDITIKVPADQVEAYKGNSSWNTLLTGGLKLDAPTPPAPSQTPAPTQTPAPSQTPAPAADTSSNTPAGKNVGFMDKVNTSVSQNSSMQMRVNKNVSEFLCVIVDGAVVPASNYTVKSGSTIITLTPQYLSTLSVGKHAVRLVFLNNDYAETDFTIGKKSAVPQTGDTLALSLGLLSLACLGTAYATRRKKA